jgi:hypothetical protein
VARHLGGHLGDLLRRQDDLLRRQDDSLERLGDQQ